MGCLHLKEPDCAVKKALSEDKIREQDMKVINQTLSILIVYRSIDKGEEYV